MNDPTTLKRPKPGDGEDELLCMQEEFLQSRQEPSAKVINLRDQSNKLKTEKQQKFRSKFAERRAMRESKLSTYQSVGEDITSEFVDQKFVKNIVHHLDQVQNHPPIPSIIIMGNIVEKKFDCPTTSIKNPTPPSNDPTGFPDVFFLNDKFKTECSTSLFHQNIKKTAFNSPFSSIIPSDDEKSHNILISDPLHSNIHNENMEKLKQMTPDEILHQKFQLETFLNPDVIKFIKSSKNSLKTSKIIKSTSSFSKINQLGDMTIQTDDISANSPFPVTEILQKATENNWMHMDNLEPSKLEWMKDLEPSKIPNQPPDEPYNARFSFDGLLLPFKDDTIPMDQGLHHHGEEPERPGYSIQELLQLTRSSTQQQRCTALTTLGNIMENNKKGWYDKALDPPLLSALNSKNILLLLRFALDDTSVAVVTASLQALRAFLYTEADEICLDRLFEWRYNDGNCLIPELSPPKIDASVVNILKDHELAQLDCILAAIRSNIIVRLRYILCKMQPTPVGVTAALEILIRISRHSQLTALNIACTKNLLDTIIKNFVPLTTNQLMNLENLKTAYGIPNITALRLLRILVEYGGKLVAESLNNLKIMDRLLSYITSELSGVNGICLSIEALRLWRILYSHGVAEESISGARVILGTQLQLLVSNHELQSSELASEYAAALIAVSSHEDTLQPILTTLLAKWSTQLKNLLLPTWSNTKLLSVTLHSVKDISLFKTQWFENFRIFEGISLASNLLSEQIPSCRDIDSLPTLGVFTQGGQLQPIISLKSCIPFLSTVVNFFYNNSMFNELKDILNNQYIIKYLERLSTSSQWFLENSWYTRAELYLITGLIKSTSIINSNESSSSIILKIAMKLVSTLPSDAPQATKDILRFVLSNERIIISRLSQELNSLKLKDYKEKYFQLPRNISAIYEHFISLGTWNQPALPRDWPYLPLVASYTRYKDEIKWSEVDTMRIVVLLNLKVAMPELFDKLSPTLRFSRIILIYLCDTICLNENVSALLRKVIPNFLSKFYKYLDFNTHIPGVGSFTDLFTSLCESFCANSYGDDGFSMVLLASIAQRHDKYYRKILWSEHAGALRYIRLTCEKLPIPFVEYLEPLEDDPTLIEVYLTALIRGTVREEWSPLMYRIALHHSAIFLKGNSKLARKMRLRIEEISDVKLLSNLLDYQGLQKVF